MADSNVIGLPGVPMSPLVVQPQADVVQTLEKWLKRAKDGELRGVCLGGVVICGNGLGISTEYTSSNGDSNLLLAAAAAIEARVKAVYVESLNDG